MQDLSRCVVFRKKNPDSQIVAAMVLECLSPSRVLKPQVGKASEGTYQCY